MKTCITGKKLKNKNTFCKDYRRPDGFRNECKECRKQREKDTLCQRFNMYKQSAKKKETLNLG